MLIPERFNERMRRIPFMYEIYGNTIQRWLIALGCSWSPSDYNVCVDIQQAIKLDQ